MRVVFSSVRVLHPSNVLKLGLLFVYHQFCIIVQTVNGFVLNLCETIMFAIVLNCLKTIYRMIGEICLDEILMSYRVSYCCVCKSRKRIDKGVAFNFKSARYAKY